MTVLALAAAAALAWLALRGVWSYAGRWVGARADRAQTVREPSAADIVFSATALRLADLPVGFTGQLHGTALDREARAQLRALGLTDASLVRVCKRGEPCVVQVRSTRIGISGSLARQVFLIPAGRPAADDAGRS